MTRPLMERIKVHPFLDMVEEEQLQLIIKIRKERASAHAAELANAKKPKKRKAAARKKTAKPKKLNKDAAIKKASKLSPAELQALLELYKGRTK